MVGASDRVPTPEAIPALWLARIRQRADSGSDAAPRRPGRPSAPTTFKSAVLESVSPRTEAGAVLLITQPSRIAP